MESPILIIGFNRPDLMKNVIDILRSIKPDKIYIHLDGPRSNSNNDILLVSQCLKELEQINWPSTIKVYKQEENLGCKKAVVFAINWAFENEERLIIIEDDINFSATFIDYCNEQLSLNERNETIMAICGYNPLNYELSTNLETSIQILYSSYPLIWGWATWRDRWQTYYNVYPDIDLKKIFLIFKNNNFNFTSSFYYIISLLLIQREKLDTWDFQLYMSCLLNKKKVVVPFQSFTNNIGFRSDATHTKSTYLNNGEPFKDKQKPNMINFDLHYRQYLRKILTKLVIKRFKNMIKI